VLAFHLIQSVGETGSSFTAAEITSGAIRIPAGLLVAFAVSRLVRRVPWPRPFRLRFLAMHLAAAPLAATAWMLLSSAGENLVMGTPFLERLASIPRMAGPGSEMLIIGFFLYWIVAGITLSFEGAARAGRAEAMAARTQLAALRAQIQPHFLFNALHTVVQLIPADPVRAAQAAELLAELLRTTLEEQRDEVSLGDEWRFVSRYLALERIRFGDRLVVREDIAPHLLDARVPAFALQTLVENAVQHGAAPRVAPTEILVAAANGASDLTLSVRNSGDVGALRTGPPGAGTGTGLARLRERLAALYGSAARLECRPGKDGGFEAVLVVPRHRGSAA
jgi:two-component system LytT family sensor kinase